MRTISLSDETADPEAVRAFARAAEAAGFDHLLLGYAGESLTADPLSMAASLLPLTRTIGLSAAIGAAHTEPYTAARGLAALDHLSGSRCAWQVQSGANEDTERLREFVTVVLGLWSGWDTDALVYDKAEAVFSISDKVRRLDHVGAHFQVRGPLNTPPPARGRLPLIYTDDAPDDLIAATADVVISRAGDRGAVGALRSRYAALPRPLTLLIETPLALAAERAAWVGDVCDGLHIVAAAADAGRLTELGA